MRFKGLANILKDKPMGSVMGPSCFGAAARSAGAAYASIENVGRTSAGAASDNRI
jgi:hypothetical protein